MVFDDLFFSLVLLDQLRQKIVRLTEGLSYLGCKKVNKNVKDQFARYTVFGVRTPSSTKRSVEIVDVYI